MSYLRYLCLLTYCGVQHKLCCVFFVFFLRSLCCQLLWIVHCWFAPSEISNVYYLFPTKINRNEEAVNKR
jgi:hypothetical protein